TPARDNAGGRDDISAADEVALADLHAVVAQDQIGSRDVEVKIRDYETVVVVLTRKIKSRVRKLQLDAAALRALVLRGGELLDVLLRFRDACVQVREGAVAIPPFRGLDA